MLDPPARAAIDDHVRLLLAWTAAINLTSIREPAEVARLHVLDSLTAVRLLRELRIERLLDLGSGGGFPGIPLAAAVPASALLVDSIAKKSRFLEVATAATGLRDRVAVAPVRAETLARDPAHAGHWPAVTVRAVAPLRNLAELAAPLLRPGGVLVAWKRGDLADEIAAAGPTATRLGLEVAGVIDPGVPDLAGHRLVILGKGAGTLRSPDADRRPVGHPRERRGA